MQAARRNPGLLYKTDQSGAAFEAMVNKIAHAPKLTNEQIKELVRQKRGEKRYPAIPLRLGSANGACKDDG